MNRKQIRQALDTVPIDRILSIPGQLTGKQKKFAAEIASGSTKAGAYRKVYSPTAKPKTAGDAGYRLSTDPRIIAEIESYRLANEAAKHRTAEQLRELVIHSLVQVAIDPEAKPAVKVQAAKVLGTVTEVAAFTERKQVTTIKSSGDIRAQIMDQLKAMMRESATDAVEIDAAGLIEELTPSKSAAQAPTHTPTPPFSAQESQDGPHTIPDIGASNITDASIPDPLPPTKVESN